MSVYQRGCCWSDTEVLTLIELWKSDKVQKELDGCVRNSWVFKMISDEMMAYGFEKSPMQCKEKIKKVKTAWRRIRDHNNVPGNKAKTFRFYNAINPVMENKMQRGTLQIVDRDGNGNANFSDDASPDSPSCNSESNDHDLTMEVIIGNDETEAIGSSETADILTSTVDGKRLPDFKCDPSSPVTSNPPHVSGDELRRRIFRPSTIASGLPQIVDCIKMCVKELLAHENRQQAQAIHAQERREAVEREFQERREEREREFLERREEKNREHELRMMELLMKSQSQLLQTFADQLNRDKDKAK